MKGATKKTILFSIIVVFALFYLISFLAYPEIGEKVLYGKHPPGKNAEILEYSEIILSENYECLESSSFKAKGDLSKFVKEFNDCNN